MNTIKLKKVKENFVGYMKILMMKDFKIKFYHVVYLHEQIVAAWNALHDMPFDFIVFQNG